MEVQIERRYGYANWLLESGVARVTSEVLGLSIPMGRVGWPARVYPSKMPPLQNASDYEEVAKPTN